MKKILFSLATFLIGSQLLFAAELEVVSKRPLAKAEQEVNNAAATFSRPVSSLTSLAKAGENCPLRVYEGNSDVPVAGRCRWQGTQTVVFEPSVPFKVSSLYRAEIKTGVKSSDGSATLSKDVSWTFETPRQSLLQSAPSDGQRWVGENAGIYLAFKYPIDPSEVSKYAEILDVDKDVPVRFSARRAEAKEIDELWKYYDNVSTASTAVLIPSGFEKGKKYKVSLKTGLPSNGSSLGLDKTEIISFETIAPLKFLEGPKETSCLPDNPRFQFSNPIKYGEFVKHIKITPALSLETANKTGNFADDYDGATWLGSDHAFLSLPGTSLKPDTKYTITFMPDLEDIFGQKLGEEKTISFRSGDVCSSVNAHSGFGVLESYYPLRHPIEAVNAGEIRMQKLGHLNKNNFIPFYTKGHNNLPAAAFASTWNPTEGVKNTKIYTYIDFEKVQEYKNTGFFYAKLTIKGQYDSYSETIWDNATDLGVTIKTSPDNILLWVTRLKTGTPANRVPIQLRDNDNKVLWNGITDKEGIAIAPGLSSLAIKDWRRWENPEIWVFADSQKGTAVMNSSWNSGIEPWRFNIDYEYSPSKETYGASLFADRGIYRTGEKANIKGFLRKLSNGDWQKADVSKVRVSLYDSRDSRVASVIANVSASSSFNSTFTIPEGSPTGVWKYYVDEETISAQEADKRALEPWQSDSHNKIHFSGDFRVEDYKPAVFEVKAMPVKKEFFLGDKFEGIADGKYLSGASLAGAKTSWSLRLDSVSFDPKGWKGYSFDSDLYEPFEGEIVASGNKNLGSKGTLKNSVKLPKSFKGKRPLRATYEAGITSPDGQNLFARGYANVHRSGLYIGFKQLRDFSKAGEPRKISFVAVHPDGKPFAGRDIKIETGKTQWIGSRRAGLGGRLEWVNEKKDTILKTETITSKETSSEYEFTPEEGGSYFFRITGKDEKGRPCEVVSEFYVYGKGDSWWMQEDNDILEVNAEKDSYKPGDTAKLFVKSPWENAQALITVEREGIMDRFVRKIESGASAIEIPIKENYIPNAYVSVILVQGRTAEPKCNKEKTECSDLGKPQGRFGYAHFSVQPENRVLKTVITSDKEEYRPGDTVKVTIKTSDENGNPVSAEAAISVADEGVLSLTSWKTPDIFSSFYGSRPLSVKTADNRLHIIGQRNYGEKGEKRGGGGGMGVSGLDMRSNFKPSAYWNPSVIIGASGEATVSFKVPDNLTRFRISGVAASGKRFGSGETSFAVNKPLMLHPILPAFARTGDIFSCGVLMQNFSAISQSGTLTSSVAGSAKGGTMPDRFALSSGSSKALLAECNAEKEGKAVFSYSAQSKEEKDGVRKEIKVRNSKNWEYNYVSGVADGNDEISEKIEIPYTGAEGKVSFEVSNSIVSGLKGTEDYIMSYPYGTLDAKLAMAQILQANGKENDAVATVNSLSNYQTSEGGFSYWNGGTLPDPYITARFIDAVYPLRSNKNFRFAQGLSKAQEWLLGWLNGSRKTSAYSYSTIEKMTAKAYASYVLAKTGSKVNSRISSLYSSRNEMSIEGRSWLLRAMGKSSYDKNAMKTLSAEILGNAKTTASNMYFEERESLPWLHSSKANTTAIVIASMLEANGGFAGDEKAVSWLVSERKTKSWWRSVPENLFAWQALRLYSAKYEKDLSSQQKVNVETAGKSRLAATLDAKKKKANSEVSFSELFDENGMAEAKLKKSGSGRTYYGYRMKFLAQPRTEPAREGFEITRTVKPLSGKTLKAGDKALVTVTVKTPQDRMFVAVNSPVPAGFEIVNTALATSGGEGIDQTGEQGYGFDHTELYEDRIVLLSDYLPAGEYKYTYLVQAVSAGDYFVPQARVECMYEPEIFGEDTAYNQKIGN